MEENNGDVSRTDRKNPTDRTDPSEESTEEIVTGGGTSENGQEKTSIGGQETESDADG
jgi:hypothetical protein